MPLPFKGALNELLSVIHNQGVDVGGARRQPCADFELNYIECLEAYGAAHGGMKCTKFMEDFQECKGARIRKMRHWIMKEEKMKKLIKGEIAYKDRLGKPYSYDAYISGTFFP